MRPNLLAWQFDGYPQFHQTPTQGFTHGREPNPAIPFDGPVDAITRILCEQFVTFPRFVWTGGWLKALSASGAR